MKIILSPFRNDYEMIWRGWGQGGHDATIAGFCAVVVDVFRGALP